MASAENGGWGDNGTWSFMIAVHSRLSFYRLNFWFSLPDKIIDVLNGLISAVVSASDISFNPGKFAQPVAASLEYIEGLKQAYVAAIGRCKKIGVDFVDLHQGHGYLPSREC